MRMQGVQNIDGSNLLDGIAAAAGNGRQEKFDFGFVSAGTDQPNETEKKQQRLHTKSPSRTIRPGRWKMSCSRRKTWMRR